MSSGLTTTAYLASSILFILCLSGLSHQESARKGNLYGMLGISIAILTALAPAHSWGLLFSGAAILLGGVIGGLIAQRVAMTAMPELVAILHSFVGLAAVLVGATNFMSASPDALSESASLIHQIEIFVGVFIGAVTFTGSIVAFGKLRGKIRSRPLLLPGRHWLNLMALIGTVVLGVMFTQAINQGEALPPFLAMTSIALFLGWHLVMAIGGADMPVVVSMLNSYSGWAAAATGFMLSNDLLIVTGALVGSSGAILSYIMCQAMNRSIWNVIFGGFGAQPPQSPKNSDPASQKPVVEISPEETSAMMLDAKNVIIIPGYGMAVAQAQYPIKEISNLLQNRGIQVRFAIHPVAGRLPGHMNVLLAEANLPYDIVYEMEEINADFPEVDVCLVIGANDIVNPGALDDTSSPIYGMPVLECWKAKTVIVMKRSMASGYSGIDNPLFYKENTRMLFGDAKQIASTILNTLQAATQ